LLVQRRPLLLVLGDQAMKDYGAHPVPLDRRCSAQIQRQYSASGQCCKPRQQGSKFCMLHAKGDAKR
jgi:hypothetical protein